MQKQQADDIRSPLRVILEAADEMAIASDALAAQAETHTIDGKLMACVPAEMLVKHNSAAKQFYKAVGDAVAYAIKRNIITL